MERLTSVGDQNYALRKAVENAAAAMAAQIYDWPAEKTRRYYANLWNGTLKLDLSSHLVHPEGIEPR